MTRNDPPTAPSLSKFWLGMLIALLVATSGQAQLIDELLSFSAAEKAFQDAIYDRAETQFSQFIRNHTNSTRLSEAILYQARAAMKQGKVEVAVQLLSTNTSRMGPFADQYRYWLGEAYLQAGEFQSAAESFARLVIQYPTSSRVFEASYGEALARFRLKDWMRVSDLLQNPESTFQKEAQLRPNDELVVRGRLLLGEALLEQGKFEATRGIIAGLPETELIPEFKWRRQYLLCRTLLHQGQLQEALTGTTNLLFLAGATQAPLFQAETYSLQGSILEQLLQYDAAAQAYTNNLVPSAPAERRRHALLKIVQLALAQDNTLQAARQMETFFSRHPADAASDLAMITLGELYLKQALTAPALLTNNAANGGNRTNHLQLAYDQFQRLTTNYPRSPFLGRAHLNRGWCFWLSDKIGEAETAFKTAATILPPSEEQLTAEFKMADCLHARKDYTNALHTYREVLAGCENYPRAKAELSDLALYQLLRTSLELQDLAEATRAMQQMLSRWPANLYADKGLLLLGQQLSATGRAEEARLLFKDFEKQLPTSSLLPQVRLALAQTYSEQNKWEQAANEYEAWLKRFGTNQTGAEALFNLGWAWHRAGRDSNALTIFTNLVVQFPQDSLAPLAQFWVADFYYHLGDPVSIELAEMNYQRLFQNTNWSRSPLAYEARMMAGRVATARQSYKSATDYFKQIISDLTFPSNIVAEAFFALGDIYTMQDIDPSKPLQKFDEAEKAFSKIPVLFPHSPLVPRAWGRIGDCYYQLGSAEPKYYEKAAEAYSKVLAATNFHDVGARSQAEIGLGYVEERLAQLNEGDKADRLKSARDHYLNVLYGANLREGEKANSYWVKQAGLSAARLAEEQKQWEVAVNIYSRMLPLLPALRPSLEKKLEKARDQLRPQAAM